MDSKPARERRSSAPRGIHACSRTALEPYFRTSFPNGFRLIVKEDHFAPIVAVAIWVGTGAADDPPGKSGLSHFFEHMFFKGTETRSVGQMDREIKAFGGYNNAATSLDFTNYYVVLPSDHYTEAIEIVSDALLHSTFSPEEVENERRVILEEIRRQEDSPLGKLSNRFFETVYGGTPYANPVLGRIESLPRIEQRDFRSFFEERYGAENVVLVVTGDVETGRVVAQAEGIFDTLKRGSPVSRGPLEPEAVTAPREFVIQKDVEQAYLSFGYAIPDVAGTKDEYALDVVAALLGEGRSSRLYRILIEERGLVSFVDCGFSAFKRAGLFAVEASSEEKSIREVQSIVLDEIGRLERDEFADEEMDRAKTLLTTGFVMVNEKASSIAGTLGLYETMVDLEAALEYSERIRRVSREEVCEAVRRYLPANGYTLGILKPKAM